jgi:MOSC domain-containing protein YiiM
MHLDALLEAGSTARRFVSKSQTLNIMRGGRDTPLALILNHKGHFEYTARLFGDQMVVNECFGRNCSSGIFYARTVGLP